MKTSWINNSRADLLDRAGSITCLLETLLAEAGLDQLTLPAQAVSGFTYILDHVQDLVEAAREDTRP